MTRRKRALRAGGRLALAILLLAAGGCPGPTDPPDPPAGALEIGLRLPDATFRPLAEGDAIPIMPISNGFVLVVLSLRAPDPDPVAVDPNILLTVDDVVIGADYDFGIADMQYDGEGWVLWNVTVGLQSEMCCYNCHEVRVAANILDSKGRRFEGEVVARLERGGCPDLAVCCASADLCPVPSLAVLCE